MNHWIKKTAEWTLNQHWISMNFSPRRGPHQKPAWYSLYAVSAIGGWKALCHSWMCCIPMCGTYEKKKKIYCRTAYSEGDTSTADLLLGVSTTTVSDKPWCSILDCDSISARTKVRSAGISHAICFWFPTALPECPTGGLGLLGKCKNFWNCLHKMYWMKLVVREMWKCTKGSLKLFNLLGFFLHC